MIISRPVEVFKYTLRAGRFFQVGCSRGPGARGFFLITRGEFIVCSISYIYFSFTLLCSIVAVEKRIISVLTQNASAHYYKAAPANLAGHRD